MKTTKKEYTELTRVSGDYTAFIKDHFDDMLASIISDHGYDHKFARSLKKYNAILTDLSEEWLDFMVMQYTAGKLFTEGGEGKKFIKKKHLENATPEEREKWEMFFTHPWRYAAFTIRKKVDTHLYLIYDIARNEDLLIYSPTITDLHEEHKALSFFTLLFYSGGCWQSYGIVHYYKGIPIDDFYYFFQMLDSSYEKYDNFGKQMDERPLPFYMLVLFSDRPFEKAVSGEPAGLYGSRWDVDLFDPEDLKSSCTIEKAKHITCLTLNTGKSADLFAIIFLDSKKETLTLAANTPGDFHIGLDLLNTIYEDLEDEPYWGAGAVMQRAAMEITGKRFPGLEYISLFEPDEKENEELPGPGGELDMEKLNSVIGEIVEAKNRGEEVDFESLAEGSGLNADDLMGITGKIDSMSVFPTFKGGIEGFTPPPPAERHIFASPFDPTGLFTFKKSQKQQELLEEHLEILKRNPWKAKGLKPSSIKVSNYAKSLERYYKYAFDTEDVTALNYSLYLLLKNGREKVALHKYAIEFLNVFGQLYCDLHDEEDVNDFITDYIGEVFLGVFLIFGLIDICGEEDGVFYDDDDDDEEENNEARDEDHDFLIKGTPRLFEWLELKTDL